MKNSQRWFDRNAQQDIRLRMSTLPVLARTGPDNPSEPIPGSNQQGKTYFKVGDSEVEGEEVAG
jgi:hypothetical protein